MKKFLCLALVLLSFKPLSAQVDEVTIRDFEERLALLYWSRDYKTLAEQTEAFLKIDSVYAGRNHFRIGMAYLQLKNYEKAEEAFRKGTKEDPFFPYNYSGLALIGKDLAQQFSLYQKTLTLSQKYYTRNYLDKRPEKMEWSLVLPRSNAWINHNIGVLYYEKKQYDSAAYYFSKASTERAEDPEHLLALAVAKYQFGRTDQARNYINRASQLNYKDYRIAALKSLFEYKKENYKSATVSIEDVKSGDSGNILLLLLQEVYRLRLDDNKNFDRNISEILATPSAFSYLSDLLQGKSIAEKEKIIIAEIEKSLLMLDYYYNGKIYSVGGYVTQTFDGKKNSEERLYIRKSSIQ